MKVLSREDVLNASDCSPVPVDVPEWGGRLFVRPMPGSARDQFELETARLRRAAGGADALGGMTNIRARLVAASACDEAGKLLFTAADVEILGQRSGVALDRVFDVSRRVNGLDGEAVDEMGKASASSSPSA